MNNERLISRFRVSGKMRPYVLRLRLSGRDFEFLSDTGAAETFTNCINQMTEILVRRRIYFVAANNAISMTLEAAAHQQLSQVRFEQLEQMKNHSVCLSID